MRCNNTLSSPGQPRPYNNGRRQVHKAVLVSEKCVPIRTFPDVHRQLTADDRSWFLYQDWAHMRPEFRERFLPETGLPERHWVHHAQWAAVSRPHAAAALARDVTSQWENTYTGDEHYFLSVLSARGWDLNATTRNACVTFTNWRESDRGLHPKEYHRLTEADVAALRTSGCLFARKFGADSDVASRFADIAGSA